MTKPVVFVIGATGHVGTATIMRLSMKYAEKVEIRAGVRHPEKAEKFRTLPNVAVVQATMGDSNLVDVLSDVDTLYIVTPGTSNREQLSISTAEYAQQAGVKHIAVVSGPQAGVPHTLIGRQLLEVENAISKLDVPYTFIRIPMFMENYFWFLNRVSIEQGVIYNAINPYQPFTTAAIEDIGTASASILVNPEKYLNQVVTIVSNLNTYKDFAKSLSKFLGQDIEYVKVTCEEAERIMLEEGVPQWLVEEVLDLTRLINDSCPAVTEGDLQKYKLITGEEPTNLNEWIMKSVTAFF